MIILISCATIALVFFVTFEVIQQTNERLN